MTTQSETSHAKTVANFETLITNVTSFGRAYNPSREGLKLEALNTLSTAAKSVIETVNTVEAVFKNAKSARDAAFKPFNRLITRIGNALKASATTEEVDESAKSIFRKLLGQRATPKKSDEEKDAAKAEGKEIVEHSSSQMSYDNRLDNFDKLIKLLASVPEYAPNEAELKVESLITLYNDLYVKNKAIVSANATLSNARINRDRTLYTPLTGVVDISVDVKSYVKSVFGGTSPQYKEISGLTFLSR
jgi:hypothetical protein